MMFEVRFTPKAVDSMAEEALWWADHHSVSQAIRWHEGFIAALNTLSELPERCPLAPENRRVSFQLYEFHYGSGSRPTHRALFRIEESTVVVLLIRRHSQEEIEADDLE